MNTKEDIWAQVQLKLLEGFYVSVVSYFIFSSERDELAYIICYYRRNKKEKSILVRKVSRRNAKFVTAWVQTWEGILSSKTKTPAVDFVFRYGANPNWVTFKMQNSFRNNVSE